MPEDQARAWRQAAAAVVEAILPDDPRQPGTWPVFAALLPHAQAALSPDSVGMVRITSYLGDSGSHVAARELWRGMREDLAQNLGPDDPGTLLARAEFAGWTGLAGDAAGARDQFAALLPVHERVLGAEHPDTLTTRGNLAYWTEKTEGANAAE